MISVLYFYIGSFLGWGVETLYAFFIHRRFMIRSSMLRLPLCPVYGLSAVFLRLTLKPVAGSLLLVFCGGFLVVSAVEYMTAYFTEQFLGVRLWDYRSLPANLHGRVCAQFSLCWGLVAVFFLGVLEPWITEQLFTLSRYHQLLLCTIGSVIFFADFSKTILAYRSFGMGEDLSLKETLPYLERFV